MLTACGLTWHKENLCKAPDCGILLRITQALVLLSCMLTRSSRGCIPFCNLHPRGHLLVSYSLLADKPTTSALRLQVSGRSKEVQAVWRWMQAQLVISLLEHWGTTESDHAEQVSSPPLWFHQYC